jgi:tripartite-type tricarboxylate transporter receptor subunit TctC
VSSERRTPQLPDVPTLSESGFPGFKSLTWNGLLAPAGTPKDIVVRVAQEVSRAVKDPMIAERLANEGIDPLGNSPEEFVAMIAADIAFWGKPPKLPTSKRSDSTPAISGRAWKGWHPRKILRGLKEIREYEL